MRRTALMIALALAGLLLAVGITMAATELTSQDVGLTSEPLTAGEALAPRTTPSTRTQPRADTTATEPAPAETTPTAPTPEVDEDEDDDGGGKGRGRGRGRGGDDD